MNGGLVLGMFISLLPSLPLSIVPGQVHQVKDNREQDVPTGPLLEAPSVYLGIV